MLMLLSEVAVATDPYRDTFQSFLIISGVFAAVANIGIVFFFISKIDSATKTNAAAIAESKVKIAASEERITQLQIELARTQGRAVV